MSLVDVQPAGPDGVATLTLTRAEKRHALSIALRDAMSDALDQLAAADSTRVVVITSTGDVFSAGFDLDEFAQPELAAQLWESSDRWHRTVVTFPLPTVAAVNGAALGGGFDLAVMCDLRLCADHATFGHPEHRFSQVVYGPLHDLVGGARARDLALTGRRVDAAKAHALGLVTRVVPAESLLTEAVATARGIAEAPRDVLAAMKAKIIRRAGVDLGATLDL
jgi:enoyl-CoA hydratase/carnithine racemase